jgi:hypothetical protein
MSELLLDFRNRAQYTRGLLEQQHTSDTAAMAMFYSALETEFKAVLLKSGETAQWTFEVSKDRCWVRLSYPLPEVPAIAFKSDYPFKSVTCEFNLNTDPNMLRCQNRWSKTVLVPQEVTDYLAERGGFAKQLKADAAKVENEQPDTIEQRKEIEKLKAITKAVAEQFTAAPAKKKAPAKRAAKKDA